MQSRRKSSAVDDFFANCGNTLKKLKKEHKQIDLENEKQVIEEEKKKEKAKEKAKAKMINSS